MNAPVESIAVPAIGAEWEGGIYAGLTLHDNTPMHLILLPGDEGGLTWKKAMAWAEKKGGVLPSRIDQLVLWQNQRDQFKDSWYWSGEHRSGGSACAWFQDFSYGYQTWLRKLSSYRARAVRRLPIQ